MLHRRRELRGELPTAYVDVQQRARETAMSRKRGDLMDVPTGPSEVRQAEMAEGMRREAEDAGDLSDTCDGLRPRPDAERMACVSIRHRQEQRTARSTDRSSLLQIGGVQLAGRDRVRDHPLTVILRMLRADPDQAVGRI